VPRGAKSRMRRNDTPKAISIKFCTMVDIPDVITYRNFGDHRLRVFWVAGGQIFPLSHRLSSSPLQHSHATAISILAVPTITVSECCLIELLPYISFEKYINISALEMARPGNRHCANCIGTLSSPIHIVPCTR